MRILNVFFFDNVEGLRMLLKDVQDGVEETFCSIAECEVESVVFTRR